MKRTFFLLTIILLSIAYQSLAWNRTGHNAVAAIAERNLTPKAKERIEKYLGNKSIVYYASWMDYYRHYPEYKATSSWHTAPVNKDLYYTDDLFKEPGNAIYGLEYAMTNLKNYKKLSDSTVAVNLYYIIHITGDMHCPVHVKYTGVSKYKVLMGDKETDYHTVWDGVVLDGNHQWSYTEWADQLDRCTPQQKAAIMKGTPRDWFHETAVDCQGIYGMVEPKGTQISGKTDRVFMNNAQALADSQIMKAGYRLAKILNDLFGS